MTLSRKMKRREYGRQQNNMLTNSMNSIPLDIPLPPRQYLRLSLSGAIKMKALRPKRANFLTSPLYQSAPDI
jgi:hypothetical protein